jgi:hypothetical protein
VWGLSEKWCMCGECGSVRILQVRGGVCVCVVSMVVCMYCGREVVCVCGE